MKTYSVGTKFVTCGKHPKICTVTDMLTTRNLANEVVNVCYVATHEFLGQVVTDREVVAVTIARGLIE